MLVGPFARMVFVVDSQEIEDIVLRSRGKNLEMRSAVAFYTPTRLIADQCDIKPSDANIAIWSSLIPEG